MEVDEDRDAPHDGALACRDGFDLYDNPYPPGTAKAAAWADDWGFARRIARSCGCREEAFSVPA